MNLNNLGEIHKQIAFTVVFTRPIFAYPMKKKAESILMRQLTIEFDMRILFKTLIEIRSYVLLYSVRKVFAKSLQQNLFII
jgi:hypothetical protein